MPTRSTMRELRKEATAMQPAASAKTMVNDSAASSASANTCWAELMKPNSDPNMAVEASM